MILTFCNICFSEYLTFNYKSFPRETIKILVAPETLFSLKCGLLFTLSLRYF